MTNLPLSAQYAVPVLGCARRNFTPEPDASLEIEDDVHDFVEPVPK